jgi:tetratricopeptide (TPR) repeat protein
MEQARELRRAGKLDEAISKLNDVVRENPDDYLATYNLALAYGDKHEYNESLAAFKAATTIQKKYDIKDSTLYNSMGWAQLLATDYLGAEESFKTAERGFGNLSPDSKRRLLNNIGLLYMYKKDYNKAENYFRRSADQYGSSLARDNLVTLAIVRKAKAATQ